MNVQDNYTSFERNGIEIEVSYDHDDITFWHFVDYLEEVGICISPYDRNSHDIGDTDLVKELADWEEDLERIEVNLDDAEIEHKLARAELSDALKANNYDYQDQDLADQYQLVSDTAGVLADMVGEYSEHIGNYPGVKVFDYNPYSDIIRWVKVYVDTDKFEKHTGITFTDVSDISGDLNTYRAFDDGAVFTVSASKDGVELDSLGGVVFNRSFPSDDEIFEYVKNGFNLD